MNSNCTNRNEPPVSPMLTIAEPQHQQLMSGPPPSPPLSVGSPMISGMQQSMRWAPIGSRIMPASPRPHQSLPLHQDQRQQLLAAFNSHPSVMELRRWLNDAPKIMEQNGHGPILTYTLGSQETISCVQWKGKFYITGTDIVKILRFRFQCLGKPVGNAKKFEEGVFSDLRNLKAGEHASLEEPKSEFLEFLYKHNCIRTQKKQKVFYWYEVHHDDLVVEAFERDAKRHNQETNISNFLRNQAAQLGYLPNGPASGLMQQQGQQQRIIPRGAMYMPMGQHPHMMMNYGGVGQQMAQMAAGQYFSNGEWEGSALSTDPALDFINDLPLEDNLSAYEPVPKSPRLSSGNTSTSANTTSIDPSLIAALPAKAQRKVRQHVQQAEACNRQGGSQLGQEVIKANELYSPLRREEIKDPLIHDPFNFEVDAFSTDISFDKLFPDDVPVTTRENDLFLFS